MQVTELAQRAKEACVKMGSLESTVKDRALDEICKTLRLHKDEIFEANRHDLENAERDNVPSPLIKRLGFTSAKLESVCDGMKSLMTLDDPSGRILSKTELADNMVLTKITCPIGVIGVIFESRPDALVQIAALCVKSGNCAILKGGSEARYTNRVLADLIEKAGIAAGLPDGFITLLETREDIGQLLSCDKYVDLIIPRGSNAFVKYIMDNTKISVMGHADGICHIYVDSEYDMNKAIDICVDAKTQYPAACNSVETLLVNKDIAKDFIPAVARALKEKGVELVGCEETSKLIECNAATDQDWATEYVDLKISIRVVKDVREAVEHINRYGSGHTDCIITKNDANAEYFMRMVDSAGVYRNCSTRFADGYRYGFGAEVGISTSKLHARGPVGLDGLVSYKYLLEGDGDTVAEFESGTKKFTHKKLG